MSFIDSLIGVYKDFDEGDNTTEESPPCQHKVDHQQFHLFLLIPSSLMILLLAFTMSRTNKKLDWIHGRPGAVYPMNILGKSHRASYAAAWGAIAFLTAEMVTEQKFAFTLHGPPIVTACNAVLSMFIYGVDYFPLFAALALESVAGYIVGTSYAWMLFAVNVTEETDCQIARQGRAIVLLRDIPRTLCLAYLSVSLPVRTFQALRKRATKFVSSSERVSILITRKTLESTSEGRHVRNLMKPVVPKPPPPDKFSEKIVMQIKDFIAEWIWNRKSDFRYSARMISIMMIGLMLVYKFTLETSAVLLTIFEKIIKVVVKNSNESTSPEAEVVLDVTVYLIRAMRSSFIAAVFFTCLIGVVSILNTLTTYRNNMRALYRGKCENIPSRSSRPSSDLLIGATKYAGFQVGYIGWGLIIHAIVLFVLAMIIAAVVIMIKFGYYQWIISIIRAMWPLLLLTVIFLVVQFVAAKLFLQGNYFALDNRRFLFTFTFFMFFYNVFLGLVSCLMRIVKSMTIGLLFLARLDHSALPKRFQMYDPGFAAYVGFIHLECAHTHPVLVVFLKLLMLDLTSRQTKIDPKDTVTVDVKDKNNREPNVYKLETRHAPRYSSRARTRWFLLYTLYSNPTIRYERKQYIAYVKELQERIEKKQRKMKEKSEIGALVTGINNTLIPWAMEGNQSDVAEQAGLNQTQINWNALMGVNRFMRAHRANRASSMADASKGVELAMLEMTNAVMDGIDEKTEE